MGSEIWAYRAEPKRKLPNSLFYHLIKPECGMVDEDKHSFVPFDKNGNHKPSVYLIFNKKTPASTK